MEYDMSILEHAKKKREIVQEIIANPGIHNVCLHKSLGMSATTLSNQLRKLRAANIIYCVQDGKYNRYYINELFLINNPQYERKQDGIQKLSSDKIVPNTNVISNKTVFFLIKNILYNSSSIHALTILDNWNVFITWFSIRELLILLYELGICIDIDQQSLFSSNIHYSPAMREELMERYEDVCCYISVQNEEFEPKRFYK